MEISILGKTYTIEERNKTQDPKLTECDGYFDSSINLIVVEAFPEKELMAQNDLSKHKMKVVRHEIIHAFLHESGLADCSDWAASEEAVDWIALQFGKLLRAFINAECLDAGTTNNDTQGNAQKSR